MRGVLAPFTGFGYSAGETGFLEFALGLYGRGLLRERLGVPAVCSWPEWLGIRQERPRDFGLVSLCGGNETVSTRAVKTCLLPGIVPPSSGYITSANDNVRENVALAA